MATWLKEPSGEGPKYRQKSAQGRLAPFVEAVKQALELDAHRPKKQRRTAKAKAMHKEIGEAVMPAPTRG